jgi:EAL domain-containing protein (putative c-di-GMP-specific phosphodiesterase class I)
VQRDGSERKEAEIHAAVNCAGLRQFMDRWLLRETLGRIVNSPAREVVFVLPLSRASLSDPGLFNWLRKALAGLDKRRPGRQIILELELEGFAAERRKAEALLSYLGKSHGFRFALWAGAGADGIAETTDGAPFNFVRLGHEALAALGPAPAEDQPAVLEALLGRGLRMVVDDVEDATTLTSVIAAGAHYAMGDFIGEPVQHLEDSTNVESFDIS